VFGSCVPDFLEGCFEPDLSGTCTSEDGITTWSDGSKYDTSSSMPGMYGPGETTPCIAIESNNGGLVASKGDDTLIYEPDSVAGAATVTCPDGSTFVATFGESAVLARYRDDGDSTTVV
jgi:hypothetical protein